MNIPLNIDWQQILLHLLNFAILAGGLYFLLYAPVKKFMDKREAYYASLAEEANKKLASAEELVKEREAQLSSVDEEIKEKKAKAQLETDAAVKQQLDEVQAQADRILADAKAAASREHNRMMNNAKRELSDMVLNSAKEAMNSASADAYDQFLSLAEGGNAHDGA